MNKPLVTRADFVAAKLTGIKITVYERKDDDSLTQVDHGPIERLSDFSVKVNGTLYTIGISNEFHIEE
ncbi:hypothetical protein N6H14_14695 [Paenibacillus sp. CC-CFT747]|nr:hypothetical protein N6H14_14695 [Paenibacillus sp. CC-CFT747]